MMLGHHFIQIMFLFTEIRDIDYSQVMNERTKPYHKGFIYTILVGNPKNIW